MRSYVIFLAMALGWIPAALAQDVSVDGSYQDGSPLGTDNTAQKPDLNPFAAASGAPRNLNPFSTAAGADRYTLDETTGGTPPPGQTAGSASSLNNFIGGDAAYGQDGSAGAGQ